MAFDFAQKLVDENGELDPEAEQDYEDELLRLFEESPEGRAVVEGGTGDSGGWVGFVVHYGLAHLGVSPSKLTGRDLDELLFDLFPRKISCEPDSAEGAINELRAFFQFAKREFGFTNADECLEILADADIVEQFQAALADPGNWGMAKTMVMHGHEQGYDMTTQAGIDAWMAAHNTGLARRDSPALAVEPIEAPSRAERDERRRKRKAKKAARKRNRR